jgi:hypothetical protein
VAHFAKIENGVVTTVVVVANEDITDENGVEHEEWALRWLPEGQWVQTSYNNKFRGCYAGIGYRYDADADVFVPPVVEEQEDVVKEEQ